MPDRADELIEMALGLLQLLTFGATHHLRVAIKGIADMSRSLAARRNDANDPEPT